MQCESEKGDSVYFYIDKLSDMLENDNSYIRTRGVVLIAYNAKWDKDYKIDMIIDKYLKHITDDKPITARQLEVLVLRKYLLPDAFVPLCGSDKGIGTAIRVLSEKGVLSEHISIQKMLNDLEKREDTFDKGCLFNVGKVLDEKEFGGSQYLVQKPWKTALGGELAL